MKVSNFPQLVISPISGAEGRRKSADYVAPPLAEVHVPVQYEESAQKKLFEKCMGLEFKITEGEL